MNEMKSGVIGAGEGMSKGFVWVRVGSASRPATPEALKKAIRLLSGDKFELGGLVKDWAVEMEWVSSFDRSEMVLVCQIGDDENPAGEEDVRLLQEQVRRVMETGETLITNHLVKIVPVKIASFSPIL